MKKKLFKKGYYTLYQISSGKNKQFEIDSGKTIYLPKLKKTILNPYRDIKKFDKIEEATSYINKKLKQRRNKKEKKLKTLPTTVYLILIEEEKSKSTFVKVGITTKKYINRRFSKKYGYDGYKVTSILRKYKTTNRMAKKVEQQILNELKVRNNVQKFRPLLESFSGYSECFNIISLKRRYQYCSQPGELC